MAYTDGQILDYLQRKIAEGGDDILVCLHEMISGKVLQSKCKAIDSMLLKQAIEHVFGFNFEVLKSGSRKAEYVAARILFSKYGRCNELNMTLEAIAYKMSKDHSTIIYYLKEYKKLLSAKDKTLVKYDFLVRQYMDDNYIRYSF